MKKNIILLSLIATINTFSQKKESTTVKLWKNTKNYISSFNDNSEYFFRDSILKVYRKKFSDYNLIEKWMKKNPPFLDNQKGNLYKVLKKTTVKVDNSKIYEENNELNFVQYIFIPHNKDIFLFWSLMFLKIK